MTPPAVVNETQRLARVLRLLSALVPAAAVVAALCAALAPRGAGAVVATVAVCAAFAIAAALLARRGNAVVADFEQRLAAGLSDALDDERDARASQSVAESAQVRAEDLRSRAEQLGTDGERIRAELEAQSVELKRSNAELEQFAYVASHDLQEPLRMVTSYVQLLARRYEGKLDADADKFIFYATDGAARMQQLINDLLAFSRVGSRQREYKPVETEQVFARVLADLKTTIEETGATVTHDPLPAVTGDAGQLAQLFQNLVANAIKFRGEKPARVHVAVQRDGRSWRFSVEDDGIGIEPQYFDRIFIIFQRLHGPKKYPGTGIGLALCRKIVERHGGRIWVESDPGRRTTFYFTLPEASAPVVHQKEQTAP